MRRLVLAAVFTILAVSLSLGQSAAAPQTISSAVSVTPPTAAAETSVPTMRGVFPLTPSKNLDSKKLKAGDAIVFTTTAPVHLGSGTLVPSGAKVLGHVVVTTARSNGDPASSLQIAFDKIQMPNGKDITMKGTLVAVAPDPGGHSGPDTGVGGGGTLPGPGGETTYAPGTDKNLAGPGSGFHPLSGGGISHPLLTSQTRGVLGFRDMQMAKDSTLTTSAKELKLPNGTQMLIQAEMPAATK